MNEIAVGLLTTLLRLTLFLSIFALMVQLVLWLGRPVSPRVHRIVWLLVLAQGWFWWRLPVTIPYEEPVATVHVSPAAEAEVAPANRATGVASLPRQDFPEQRRDASGPTSEVNPEWNAAAIEAHWLGLFLGSWLAGMIVVAGAGFVSYVRFLGHLWASGAAEPEWTQEWEDLCARQGLGKRVAMRVSDNLGPLLSLSPWGYRLVVPAALWQRLSPDERLSLLRHELAHLERHDLWKSMLVRLLLLPHWFNPLAWLAAGRFDEAAEWACDEAAQGLGSEARREYAQALLQLDAVRGQYPLYHAAAWGRGLSARVSRLLHHPVKEDSLMKRMFVLGMALSVALVCMLRFELVAQEPAKQSPVAVEAAEEPAAAVGNFREMPQDAKLTEDQRVFRDWDADTFGVPEASRWQKLSTEEKAAEEAKYLEQLASEDEKQRVEAIDALVGLGSKKAVPGVLQIAVDRKEKNNWDRHTACRALGMLSDRSVVPELVHLTYHHNTNVRLWAQISLVRLTGENFGRDVAAWARWWGKQGGKPPISEQPVVWATSPKTLPYADPEKQEEMDRQFVEQFKNRQRWQHPRDAKLTDIQRAMRDITEQDLAYRLDPSRWENLAPEEKATEEAYWLKQLSSDRTGARNLAIFVLTALESQKAVPGLLAIATERREKDNADRSYACRALGIAGDLSVVPELVPLTYHYNRDTRLWSQISLVRLTGENFGRDVAAWTRWWKEQGHTPPISEERVAWATSPETLPYADPTKQEELDRMLLQSGRQTPGGTHFARERAKAMQRMARDRELFSEQQLNEMESLTRTADQNFGRQAAWDAMKRLVDTYKNANRTGCSLVYLGQMDNDGRKLAYFEEAIAKHSDCFYGDGVQVGAFARFLLGQAYMAGGRVDEAKKLFEEIRRDYPESIDHNGQLLVDQLPK